VSETYINPQGTALLRVFCFQWHSDDFTESHGFAGTFDGICALQIPRYQQFGMTGHYWPTCSRCLSNRQYNLDSNCGTPSKKVKDSAFNAVNKWWKFVQANWLAMHLIKTIRFSFHRKTIHPAVNPQLSIQSSFCQSLAVARYFFN